MEKKNSAIQLTGELLQYGGQAVIEGVMMRSPRYFAVACRKPQGENGEPGEIVVQREEVDKSLLGKLKWLNKPFLRGTLALLDAMILGTRALTFASSVQLTAEQERHTATSYSSSPVAVEAQAVAASGVSGMPEAIPTKMPLSGKINDIAIGGAVIMSLVFGFLLFRATPTLLTELFQNLGWFGASPAKITLNFSDGFIRMALFFSYISLISFHPGIKAVFMYHGAEHKAINTLEAGEPLTTENALRASRIHPRCGTSFIFIVLIIDWLIVLFLPRPDWYWRLLLHLAILPPVAGISFEVIKFAGKYRRNRFVNAVYQPGMWTQLLTTREPTPDQVEVALAALHSVLEAEGHRATENPTEASDTPAPAVPEPEAEAAIA